MRARCIVQRSRQQGGFQFAELEIFGVLHDVYRRRRDVLRVFEFDQPLLLQQQQRTARVGGVVGNGDGGAVFEFAGCLDLGWRRGSGSTCTVPSATPTMLLLRSRL